MTDEMRYTARDEGCESTALHAAMDAYGAADKWPGGELMTAAERFDKLPAEVQSIIIAEVIGAEDDAPRWTGGDMTPAPASWFDGWGSDAMEAV